MNTPTSSSTAGPFLTRTLLAAPALALALLVTGCGATDTPTSADPRSGDSVSQADPVNLPSPLPELALGFTTKIAAAPAVEWTDGMAWMDSQGRAVPQSVGALQVRWVGDEFLVTRVLSEDAARLEVVSGHGAVTSKIDVTSGPAVDAERSVAAWITTDGVLTLHSQVAQRSLGSWPGASVAAVTGPGCDASLTGCTVYLQAATSHRVVSVDADGEARTVARGVTALLDVRQLDDRRIISAWVDDVHGKLCSRLVPEETVYCGVRFGQLAPGSAHVTVAPELTETGPMPYLELWTTDRPHPTLRITAPTGGTIWSSAWEDAEHLLVVGGAEDRWQIWRVGLSGDVEAAADAQAGSDGEPPFVLGNADFH